MPRIAKGFLEWRRLRGMHGARRVLPVALERMNMRRNVRAARRRQREIRRHDEAVLDLGSPEAAALDLVVDHHVVGLSRQGRRLISEPDQPLHEGLDAAHRAGAETGVGPVEMTWKRIPLCIVMGSSPVPG